MYHDVLLRNSKSQQLFLDMSEMSNMSVKTIGGAHCRVPASDVVISGLVCKSRSKLNSKGTQYRDSYSTGQGESADSFWETIRIFRTMVMLLAAILETVSLFCRVSLLLYTLDCI